MKDKENGSSGDLTNGEKSEINGTQESVDDDFFGTMGCNGTVRLKFSSPVYLWLLETVI